MKLPASAYEGDTLEVAKRLLGHKLVHIVDGQKRSGYIVEVEAYQGPADKAAHSYGGKPTKRTSIMYGPPAHAYVYLIYGMYYCFNIVTAPANIPHAILVRALMPADGHEDMLLARYGTTKVTKQQLRNVTNGPGKLTKAMGITIANNGESLISDTLYIEEITSKENLANQYEIAIGPRINIGYAQEAIHYPWRFYLKGNEYVSK
ncbi:DNA-3-methyladenine glycosylase [Ectobacillus polymachus]|uniref:DNA-3-methyladenine glycosylase n=1 Tax=Ectobacillus polymachus TaxID=1508806 RepID=UPI003A882BDD